MKKYSRFQIFQPKEKILSCLLAQNSHSIQEAIFSSCFFQTIKRINWMYDSQSWSDFTEFSVKNKQFEIDPNLKRRALNFLLSNKRKEDFSVLGAKAVF